MSKEKIVRLHKQFFEEEQNVQYLLRWFYQTKRALAVTTYTALEEFRICEDFKNIGNFYQTFWEELPDNISIHCGPFYLICDIAELYTCLYEDDEDYP